MKMYVLLLFVCGIVVGQDSDESKYVDLLPENEKEAFLEKVARRIIEDVEVKGASNKTSVEVSDDELQEHDAFVKKILKEESNNIRRNKDKGNDDFVSEEDVRVKSLERVKAEDRDDNLDLTLRTDKEVHKTDNSSIIPVEVITDYVEVTTKLFDNKDKSKNVEMTTENNDYLESSKEDIQVRNVGKHKNEHELTTEKSEVQVTEDITVVKNIITDNNNGSKYPSSSKEELQVKNIKRRAIESSAELINNNTHTNEPNIKSNLNENVTDKITVDEVQHTLIENFDTEKEDSSMDMTNYKPTVASTIGTSTIETKSQMRTFNKSADGKESIENYQFTQKIYDSEVDMSSDSSNETDEVKKINTASTPIALNDATVKENLRSNDKNIAAIDTTRSVLDNIDNTVRTAAETSTDTIANNGQLFTITERRNNIIKNDTAAIVSTTATNINDTIKITEESSISYKNTTNLPVIVTQSPTTSNQKMDSTTEERAPIENNVTKNILYDMLVKNISLTPDAVKNNTNIEKKNEKTKLTVTVPPIRHKNNDNKIEITTHEFTNSILTTTELVLDKENYEHTTKNTLNTIKDLPSNTAGKVHDTHKTYQRTKNNKNTEPQAKLPTKNNEKINAVAEKAVNMLRDNLFLIKSDETKTKNYLLKGLQKEFYSQFPNKGGKEYQVYEIPADKPPFIKGPQPITEQPYYVPVYNYSPNKAYFIAQNRLGPNAEDEEAPSNLMETKFHIFEEGNNLRAPYNDAQKSYGENLATFKDRPKFDDDYYFDGSNKQRKIFGNQYFLSKTTGINKLRPTKRPLNVRQPIKSSYKEISYDPLDYVDFDYRHLRGLNVLRQRKDCCEENSDSNECKKEKKVPTTAFSFPKSDEELHPYRSINEKNLKNHIRAVRNVLFEKQLFSYPLKQPEQDVEETTESELQVEAEGKGEGEAEGEAEEEAEGETGGKAEGDADGEGGEVGEDTRYFRNGDKRAITLDYYFGRMNPEIEKPKKYYHNVGYLKKNNETKNVYINKELLNDKLIKYISSMKLNDDRYVNEDYMQATPHTNLVEDVARKLGQLQQNDDLNSIKANASSPYQVNTIQKVLSITNERDVFEILEKLEKMNIPVVRRREDHVNVYVNVLRDMVRVDDEALKQYDWLGSTVDLQSALDKLWELIEAVQNSNEIHPSDLELLKYVIFLHKFSNKFVDRKELADKLRNKYILPRNKRKRKRIVNEKGLLNRVWLYLRKKRGAGNQGSSIDSFTDFLIDLQDGLLDLHEAIKNIAKITKYKTQNWYKNIKELYLSDDKSYLTLLLHLTSTRLFGLIDNSAENGLELSFRSYVKENRPETIKAMEEMLAVINIVNEIRRFD